MFVSKVWPNLELVPQRRLLGHNPRRDIHRYQFLEHQLTRIRQFHIIEIDAVIAGFTIVDMHLVIERRNQATAFTDMDPERIRHIVHPFFREPGRAM
jgi:hypothetical protein